MTTATSMRKQKPKTIGSIIDAMATLRDERRKLSKQDDELKTQYEDLQSELIAQLQDQGTVQGSSTKYTAAITQSEVFNIVDFDAWVKFANKNKLTHAFYKQVSAPSVREYVALKGKVPDGLEPFTKVGVSLTARS